MKKLLLAIAMMTTSFIGMNAQTMTTQEMADRMALKNLVDTFSNLADVKDIDTQVLLFTEDGVVTSTANGQTTTLAGRKQMGDAFKYFLGLFETVYHINGQQTVEINGDKATGIAYCEVVLIRDDKGKKMMNTQGVRYNDEYVRVNGKWLIAKRTSNFVWSDTHELGK